ncbi:hypothetical protein BX666DRAFT_855335 [Dichotomocladium elegans]|nr:hypothetical protein BX666DRAFT_855335 [Dichotomocladium elegans]
MRRSDSCDIRSLKDRLEMDQFGRPGIVPPSAGNIHVEAEAEAQAVVVVSSDETVDVVLGNTKVDPLILDRGALIAIHRVHVHLVLDLHRDRGGVIVGDRTQSQDHARGHDHDHDHDHLYIDRGAIISRDQFDAFRKASSYTYSREHRRQGNFSSGGSGACFNCNKPGHLARDCPLSYSGNRDRY